MPILRVYITCSRANWSSFIHSEKKSRRPHSDERPPWQHITRAKKKKVTSKGNLMTIYGSYFFLLLSLKKNSCVKLLTLGVERASIFNLIQNNSVVFILLRNPTILHTLASCLFFLFVSHDGMEQMAKHLSLVVQYKLDRFKKLTFITWLVKKRARTFPKKNSHPFLEHSCCWCVCVYIKKKRGQWGVAHSTYVCHRVYSFMFACDIVAVHKGGTICHKPRHLALTAVKVYKANRLAWIGMSAGVPVPSIMRPGQHLRKRIARLIFPTSSPFFSEFQIETRK